ncbi:Hypothetical protein PBC10988_6180 [Planctomycetales bacterium 10988]|nr:Hypothetical protein PBC10988_6180 [Planctomycetales bacterium 10988]
MVNRQDLRATKVRRAGFTLVELIIVLLVLAALASMLIPTLGYVKDMSDTATSAAAAQEIVNNLEIYKASTGRYPNRLDSLVSEDGTCFSRLYGGSSGTFQLGTIGAGDYYAYYAFNNGAGMDELMLHTNPEDPEDPDFDPNSAGVLGDLGPSTQFCIVDYQIAKSGSYGSFARNIVNICFPNQEDPSDPVVPEYHTLVALGVGPYNSAVGATMTSAPLVPEKSGSNPLQYDRYIAIFDADIEGGGSRGRGQVKLKCVIDSEFNVVGTNLRYYKQSAPGDSYGFIAEEEEEEE